MAFIPSPKQLKFLSWETGMFFHFGIRSFYPGHVDWDGRAMDAAAFRPERLDVHNWLRAAKLIGAKYAILTAKHHDGFALWPTKMSAYSVAASPWRDGKGDVVREFVQACREEDMAVGLYYSPAQWDGNSATVSFSDAAGYDEYFIGQISELLTNYGKIDYLWFDGCGSNGHEYDQKRIISVIRSLQPDILIFDMWDGDTRWVGNEDGYAPYPNPYVVTHRVLGEDKQMFIPAECDCKLRESWFYDHNAHTIKSVDELMGMYELSVGRGSNLLLNVGPDPRGLIDDMDMKRLSEFSSALNARYGHELPFEAFKKTAEGRYLLAYSAETQKKFGSNERIPPVRALMIKEDVSRGQKVFGYRVYAHVPSLDPVSERVTCVFTGSTIGNKALVRLPDIRSCALELEITDSDGEARISDFRAY